MYRGPVQWKWQEDDNFYFTTYRRPLMDYINMLANNELYIYKSEELMPNKVEADWNQVENNLRTTYPSTMVIVAKKHE